MGTLWMYVNLRYKQKLTMIESAISFSKSKSQVCVCAVFARISLLWVTKFFSSHEASSHWMFAWHNYLFFQFLSRCSNIFPIIFQWSVSSHFSSRVWFNIKKKKCAISVTYSFIYNSYNIGAEEASDQHFHTESKQMYVIRIWKVNEKTNALSTAAK
jgi:hypothetical protein